jgi:5-methylcytosine-specific restriction enzyme subunit McrC
MAYLFQSFVYNFLQKERRDLRVQRENIKWKAASADDPDFSLLPIMQTDISVQKGDRKIVIDTKFYRETLSKRYNAQKIHSSHLYQLLCYLGNLRSGNQKFEGILLYPTTDRDLSVNYLLLDFPVRIQTIDLAAPWQQIHNRLVNIVN